MNQSLSGISPELSSKHMTETGKSLATYDLSDDDNDDKIRQERIKSHLSLPGSKVGELKSKRKGRDVFFVYGLTMSQDGQQFFAATSQGLFVYTAGANSQAMNQIYRPIDQMSPLLVTKNVNLQNIFSALSEQYHAKALILSLGLNDYKVLKCVYHNIPFSEISVVAQSVPPFLIPVLLNFIRICLVGPITSVKNEDQDTTLYLQCHIQWLLNILTLYAPLLQSSNFGSLLPTKAMQDSAAPLLNELSAMSSQQVRSISLVLMKCLISIHQLLDKLFGTNIRIIQLLLRDKSQPYIQLQSLAVS